MSFKDGIPLLSTFDDDDTEDENFTISTLPRRRKKINKRHVLFGFVLLSALFLIVAVVVAVTVPVLMAKQSSNLASDSDSVSTQPSTSVARQWVTPSNKSPASTSYSNLVTPSKTTSTPTFNSQSLQIPSSTHTVVLTSSPLLSSSYHSLLITSVVSTTSSLAPLTKSSSFLKISSSISHSTSLVTTPGASIPSTKSPFLISSQSVLVSPTPIPGPDLYQSKYDTRDYKFVTLDNQLQVLLISDPETDLSAASMDVAAGSFNDPDDTLGLAHFCEHMLFLGTTKYPEEGQYSEYLHQHGGYDNAYTSSENTNYHFSVVSEYLEMGLDMFAQFFISPLFTESLVNKEKNAVNSEYQKDLLDDDWRNWEILKHVSNPKHPFHYFNIGSLNTLSDPTLHQKLLDYYNSHYSANRMHLVMYGRDNLTTLSHWLFQSFSNITNRHTPPTVYNTTSFPPPYNRRLIYYYPVANTKLLRIYWQVPSLVKKYRNAISSFITRYLGQELTGSVLYLLKIQGLATSLSAGSEIDTDNYSLLYVEMVLTDKGLRAVSKVIQAAHWYMGLLRAMNESEFLMRFKEYQMTKQNVFDYGKKAAPLDYVKSLAANMRVVEDSEDILSSPQRYIADYQLYQSTLSSMYPDNATIFISSQLLNISSEVANATETTSQGNEYLSQSGISLEGRIPWPTELDMYEPYFKIPYTVKNVSDELINFWSDRGDDFNGLMLPQRNEFIVGDLEIQKKANLSLNEPMEILTEPGISLWWLLDTVDFPEPRVNVNCNLTSKTAVSTPHREALTLLFSSVINAELTTQLYDATEVGFTFDLSPTPMGVSLSVTGLSDHTSIKKLLSTVIEKLLSNETSELFEATKHAVMEKLTNYNYTTLPYRYTTRYVQKVLMNRPYWKHWQVLAHLTNLTQEDVQSFVNTKLLSNLTLLCLAHGNIDQKTAMSYGDLLKMKLKHMLGEEMVMGQPSHTRVQLADGTSYVVSMPTLNPEDMNSVVNILFQVGDVCTLQEGTKGCTRASLLLRLHLQLLDQMINSECFNVLRTEQQLGYAVFCFSSFSYGTGSFQVLIQSQVYNASIVYNRIDNFLKIYYNRTLSLASFNKTFTEQAEVLKSSLEQRDLTLADRTARLWRQVETGQRQFNYNQQLVDIINEGSQDFSADSMREFYCEHILNEGGVGRKLLTVLYGKEKDFSLPSNFTAIDYSQLNQTSNSFSVD